MDENIKWIVLILSLLYRTNKQWRDFEDEIKYNHRFFPKGELLDELKRIQCYAVYEIKKGETFYRARLFDFAEHYRKELKRAENIILKYYPDMKGKDALFDVSNLAGMEGFLTILPFFQENNQQLYSELGNVFKQSKRFWGYNQKDSDAPPKEKTPSGRANPKNISYLYLADDLKTAILEVRPNLNQDVSVATVKIMKDLKLFDFCYTDKENEQGKSLDLGVISSAFSKPNYGGEDNYYATQYVCEFIREMGFDGIRFYSSLNPEGKNIVLFDTEINPAIKCKNYKITSSKVYTVTKLGIDFQQEIPISKP